MSPETWLKIEAVFQRAAELQPHERAQFLDRKCGSDAFLRAEVEKLLRNDAAAGDFIESPVWSESALFTTSAKRALSASVEKELSSNGQDDLLGTKVGVWRLSSELGRGGMGAVYLAERSDGEFRQRAAIKLIKRGMDSDFIIRRFRHERQILASFEHPFIARLLDGGTTADGVPYFVMEYIEGDTLYNYCDAKALSIRDRLKLFQKICSAIQYAHERQIVHRDIKPGNILIGVSGTPKLLDFGIAKILDSDLIHESVNPTASMLRMMTPDYASPEQVRGADVTPASDIYSLGVLLYELLTGHRPYNFEGRSLHEVSRVICEVVAPAPSKAIFESSTLLKRYTDKKSRFLDTRRTDQKQLLQELERNLDDVIMKAISKDPEKRYLSAKELSEDISRHLNGSRVIAPPFVANAPPTTASETKAQPATMALAVLPFKYLNLDSTSDIDNHFLAFGLADALITRLSKIRRFSVRPTGSVQSFLDKHMDPVRAGQALNVNLILDGNIKRAGNRLRVSVQLLDVKNNATIWATSIDETVADVLTLETILANKVIDVLLPQLTGSELEEFAKRGTDDPEAFEHYLRGRYHFNKSTEDGFAQAFVEFHAAIASDPKYALAYCGIADYYNWLGIIGVLPPQECFEPAIRAASKALELDPASSEAHASLAFSLHAGKYDWARAERHFLNAIELNPNNANAYVWYALVLYTVGRFDEGIKYAKQSIELDPLTPFNHHNLGWGLYFARRFDEAATQYEKVVAEFPSYNFGHYGLSKVYRITGRTSDAIVENDEALELTDNSVFAMLSDAECYAADGQTIVAKQKISALEELSMSRYVSPYQIALGYCFLGDSEAALRNLEISYRNNEAWLNWMGVEPALDPVRNEPRFQRILEKIGYASLFADASAETRATGFGRDHIGEVTTMRIIAGDETEDGAQEPRARSWSRWLTVAAVTAVLAAMAIISIAWLLWHTERANPSISGFRDRTIVILPFRAKENGDAAMGIGLADALTTRLGSIKSLEMIAANAGRSIAVADPVSIGTELRAAYVLSGELSTSGDRSRIDARLISTGGGQTIWFDTITAPKGDFFTLQTALAEKVWTALGIEPVALEMKELRKPYTASNEAYRYYLLGRTQMTDRSPENLRRSIATFSHAIAEDPDFALAYAGLADAHALLNLYEVQPPADAYPKARAYAHKALELDDGLAEAHASLGYVKFYYERDRAGAELEFRRAIQLNQSYAQARHWFALTLTAMGKNAEALGEAEVAQRLDPLSPSIRSATGVIYFMSGKNAESIAECDRALTIDPSFIPAFKVKRWAYTLADDAANARAIFSKELELSKGSLEEPGWRVIDLQMRGLTAEATVEDVDTTAAREEIRSNPFFFAYEVALAYIAVGNKEKAVDWLERAEAAGNHSFNFLAVDPRLDSLRSHLRFQKLMRKFV